MVKARIVGGAERQVVRCDLAESLHFCFVLSLYVLATLTCGPDDALVCLR